VQSKSEREVTRTIGGEEKKAEGIQRKRQSGLEMTEYYVPRLLERLGKEGSQET